MRSWVSPDASIRVIGGTIGSIFPKRLIFRFGLRWKCYILSSNYILPPDFFKYRKSDPNEVVVELPESLVASPPVRNDNFVRSSMRRSYKYVIGLTFRSDLRKQNYLHSELFHTSTYRRVKKALVRTGSLRSMTEEERQREDNANYDVEPTTAWVPAACA